MNTSNVQGQCELHGFATNCSPLYLLELGLRSTQQGHYAEGVVYFALIHEQLSIQNASLAAALDDFIQGHTLYWQAQQQLHEASRRFVEADTLLQTRMAAIEKRLPEFRDEMQHLPPVSPSAPAEAQPLVNEDPPRVTALSSARVAESNLLPALNFTCFGRFEVRRLDQPLTLCSNRNGQAILRYLVVQPDHCATMDTLMEVFWPDDEPDIAHHKLQVAVSALRRSLNGNYNSDAGGGYVLCRRQVYQLNPALTFHSDLDDFLTLYRSGRRSDGDARAEYYEHACQLYKGPFLADDLYADWPLLQRGQISSIYLTMCNALVEHFMGKQRYEDTLTWSGAILEENPCEETAHQYLMRAYAALGRRTEALRQYHRCQQILFEELGVEPMPETVKLFHTLLNGEQDT